MAPVVTDNPPSRDDEEGGSDGYFPEGFSVAPVTVFNAAGSDSEEEEVEEDDPEHGGYVLLSQSETDETEQQHYSHVAMEQQFLPWPEDESENLNADDECQVTSTAPFLQSEIGKDEAAREPKMDHEHIERIKSAMSGFALPTSAFPSWAGVVPEDQWKDHLLAMMGSSKAEATTSRQPLPPDAHRLPLP